MHALPLTPSGKVDRGALSALDSARPGLERELVAPRDPWERHLASIWEQLLGFGPIGVKDDFFELGGHSLLAARLFTQIEQRWGRVLPLVAHFQAPTVRRRTRLPRVGGSCGGFISTRAVGPVPDPAREEIAARRRICR